MLCQTGCVNGRKISTRHTRHATSTKKKSYTLACEKFRTYESGAAITFTPGTVGPNNVIGENMKLHKAKRRKGKWYNNLYYTCLYNTNLYLYDLDIYNLYIPQVPVTWLVKIRNQHGFLNILSRCLRKLMSEGELPLGHYLMMKNAP